MKIIFKPILILMILTILFSCFIPMRVQATTAADTQILIQNNRIVLDTGFNSQDDVFNHILTRYKTVITFFSAMAAITMMAIFIYLILKLAGSSTNPMERGKCITGLLITGVATALLGSASLFVGLFYNALN